MSSIFQSRIGQVTLLSATSSIPGTLLTFRDGGPGGVSGPRSFRVQTPIMVTGIGYNQAVNIQFMPTLRKLVYVYSFGDRMGDLQVSGVAFDNACPTGGLGGSTRSGWGTREVLDYYAENRAVRDGQTVAIDIANRTISGFLIGVSLSIISVEFKTVGFRLDLATLPGEGS